MSSSNKEYEEIPACVLDCGVPTHDEDNAPRFLYEEDVDAGWMYMQGGVAKQLRKAICMARDSESFSDLDRIRLDVATQIIDGTFQQEVTDE